MVSESYARRVHVPIGSWCGLRNFCCRAQGWCRAEWEACRKLLFPRGVRCRLSESPWYRNHHVRPRQPAVCAHGSGSGFGAGSARGGAYLCSNHVRVARLTEKERKQQAELDKDESIEDTYMNPVSVRTLCCTLAGTLSQRRARHARHGAQCLVD